MLKMNESIRQYILKDYAGNLPQAEIRLDCALGVNQEDLPDLVFARLHELNHNNQGAIKDYPHGDDLQQALAAWYQSRGLSWLAEENLLLGNGSYGLLCGLNLLCLGRNKKVLGIAPQFTAYVDHVHCLGAVYDAYLLERRENYRFQAEGYLARMDTSHDLFILENPNNPTGQALSLADLEEIAARAAALKTILVVDEAYGDYLDLSCSALNLLADYANLVVIRSFSKGFGMAGLRLGYAAANTAGAILPQLAKIALSFNCNALGRLLAKALLESGADLIRREDVIANKQQLLAGLTRLKAAATADSTPILTLYHDTPDQAFDLQRHLLETVGLQTVSCANSMGLDSRAVRLMLPKSARMEQLLQMLEAAEALLPTAK